MKQATYQSESLKMRSTRYFIEYMYILQHLQKNIPCHVHAYDLMSKFSTISFTCSETTFEMYSMVMAKKVNKSNTIRAASIL